MNLVIDIGNTRAKVALFSGPDLVEYRRWPEINIELLQTLLTNQNVKNIILSSVGQTVAPETEDWLKQKARVIRFTSATPVPVKNKYQTPETLGLDRMAAVAGAFARYPRQNCLVVDAGTCMTFDILEEGGVYLGGNISPGLQMRLQAMATFTARLPLVEIGEVEEWIGTSTQSALRNGAVLGALLEIEGYIGRCESRWKRINIILTGGDAGFLAKSLKKEIFVHENLVLEGLNKILHYNVKAKE